ncbi:MAG: PKD domain-containing protein, partial [Anaerolineae bacterium]|nr:PKD domain-containing protein [Anaerolineae bacterium]
MRSFIRTPRLVMLLALVLLALVATGCNLTGGDVTSETIDTTPSLAFTLPPTRTAQSTSGIPTPLPGVTLPSGQPTTIGSIPTAIRPPIVPQQPSPTPLPISIVILSPVPGNIIAGNVQVIGAAVHPNFLQYQIEFGPDPNPGNLWFPATGAVQTPVLNGLLGIWNTTNVNDGTYQVRLRVYLRDGTTLTTVVNNIRVQNRVPTPQPSATPNIPRPIAAFTLDRVSGQVPLTVRFTNQSSGQISSYQWTFGDNSSSTEINPVHTFNSPGLYTVTLTVTGPGGSSNVSQQINAQAPNAPNASFTANPSSGNSPLVAQFTNTSTGTINTYAWNFSDGGTSNQQNPVHTFIAAGTYNVFLTVTGPGGSSTVTQPITVINPSIPTNTPIPPSVTPVPPTNTPESTVTAI